MLTEYPLSPPVCKTKFWTGDSGRTGAAAGAAAGRAVTITTGGAGAAGSAEAT